MESELALLAASFGNSVIERSLAEPHSLLLIGVALGGILLGRFVLDRKQD